MTAPWHRDPAFVKAGRLIRQLANTNPAAVCWRDGDTLAEHRRRMPGVTLRWTAGHTRSRWNWRPWLNVTERPPLPGDWLAPEVSRCNYSNGAADGNGRRTNHTSRDW